MSIHYLFPVTFRESSLFSYQFPAAHLSIELRCEQEKDSCWKIKGWVRCQEGDQTFQHIVQRCLHLHDEMNLGGWDPGYIRRHPLRCKTGENISPDIPLEKLKTLAEESLFFFRVSRFQGSPNCLLEIIPGG
ncbi:MAG: hypothetical protein WCP39_02820 [Chlamydiota bacterium]